VTLQRLEVTPFTTIIREIITNQSTGQLVLARAQARRIIYWVNGEIVLVASTTPSESLWAYLVHQNVMDAEQARALMPTEATSVVPTFHSLGAGDSAKRQSLLKGWLNALVLPLFAVEEGTAAFTDGEAIEPDQRIFLQSVASVVCEGVRSISSGLVVRNSLGDLTEVIALDEKSSFPLETLPLTDAEMKIANSLREPAMVGDFIKNSGDVSTAAKVAIMLRTLGVFEPHRAAAAPLIRSLDSDPQRDLALLAAIGPGDQRSLRMVALAKQIPNMDFYTFLDLPRGSTTSRLVERCEEMKREYEPSTFPAAAREFATEVARAVDKAMSIFSMPEKRQTYDRLLSRGAQEGRSMQQLMARRHIAYSNLEKARELTIRGDYYAAIVLLKQTVHFDPSIAEAWHLLGTCQERNPKWRRDAAVSYQKALAADPNYVEAMISAGDLFRIEGLGGRAQNFYQDALLIDPEHVVAKNRMKEMKKVSEKG
jgi:tetratricopeptide (TPR) repeat protein